MNGLELCRAYFEEYGRPMLERDFPELLPHIAAGLFGGGSECLGFDDEISRDHDFEAGFLILLPDEDVIDRKAEFRLERAYAKLPAEFEGVSRPKLSPVGGARRGVLRISELFTRLVGSPDGGLSLSQWLTVPSQSLLEATCGEIYLDGSGEVTAIREALSRFPDDVRRKRLAGQLLIMAQAGQYNYPRCIAHGESGAAQLAACEFAKAAISAIFLLNDRYEPYYKWSFRALRALPRLSIEAELLEYLITSGNDDAEEKSRVIEGVAADVIDELAEQGLTQAVCGDLEKHAYSVNDGVTDGELRNMHVLSGV